MRVSDNRRYDRSIADLQRSLSQLDRAQQQIATGRRLLRPSDDPAGAAVAVQLRAAESAIEANLRSLGDARAWLGIQDSALQGASNIARRVQELATQAQNPALSTAGRDAIAGELTGLREQLATIANTTYQGQAVFGAYGASAVTLTPTGATFVGQPGAQVQRQISDSEVMAVNTDGAKAFGFAAGDDVFTVIARLATSVQSGNSAAIAADAVAFTARADDLRAALGDVGSRASRVEATIAGHEDRIHSLAERRSATEDADLSAAAVELTKARSTYEAVLATIAQTDRLSLVDYLR